MDSKECVVVKLGQMKKARARLFIYVELPTKNQSFIDRENRTKITTTPPGIPL